VRVGLGISDKKNSAEDGIDETRGLFRRNSGCSAEQKTLRIPFQTISRKRKMLGIQNVEQKKETIGIPFRTIPRRRNQLRILFCGTKIEENFWKFVSKHFAEENTLSILCKLFWLFGKTNFFRLIPFHSELRN
jgi:hypothetical protein